MPRNCYCRFCKRPTDCNGDICELCEVEHPNEPKQCTDGHCDICLEEIKPNIWKFKGEDGKFFLRRVDPNE